MKRKCLFFRVWLNLVNTTISSSIHFAENNVASFFQAENIYYNYTGFIWISKFALSVPCHPELPQIWSPSASSSRIARTESAQLRSIFFLLNFRHCFREFKFKKCLIFIIVTNNKWDNLQEAKVPFCSQSLRNRFFMLLVHYSGP